MFPELKTLSIAQTPEELYNSVLVDTPLAPYFLSCVSRADLDELNIEIIRNTLYKVWRTMGLASRQQPGLMCAWI